MKLGCSNYFLSVAVIGSIGLLVNILLTDFQDGGSLDQILKKADQLPEEILGKITLAVSAS